MNHPNHTESTDRPIPSIRPPYLFGYTLLAGLFLNLLYPISIFSDMPLITRIISGIVIVAAGFCLIMWAGKTLLRSNVDPRFKPVGGIVSDGPFHYSRNPMYVSFTLIYLGISLLVNALTPILLLPFVLIELYVGVIKREEKYLKNRFGEAYTNYCSKVRRWI